jgi:hypothetical protein
MKITREEVNRAVIENIKSNPKLINHTDWDKVKILLQATLSTERINITAYGVGILYQEYGIMGIEENILLVKNYNKFAYEVITNTGETQVSKAQYFLLLLSGIAVDKLKITHEQNKVWRGEK